MPGRFVGRRPRGEVERPGSRAPVLAALVVVVGLLVAACGGGDDASGVAELPVTDLRSGEATTVAGGTDGQPTVVNVWASWCAPCVREMPAIEAVSRSYGDRVAFVGLTDDPDRDAALELADQTGVTYRLVQSGAPDLFATLGITNLPATVFLDADGRVVERHVGTLDEATLTEQLEATYGL